MEIGEGGSGGIFLIVFNKKSSWKKEEGGSGALKSDFLSVSDKELSWKGRRINTHNNSDQNLTKLMSRSREDKKKRFQDGRKKDEANTKETFSSLRPLMRNPSENLSQPKLLTSIC